MPNLRTFDLNLLRVFEAISRDGSVSRAADSLGMSQPAVSNALNRLREQLEDPLFIRTAEGMEPTRKAERLAAFVNDGLTTIRSGLTADMMFDPASASRRFHLLMTDVGAITFLPEMLATLSREAPNIDIAVSELSIGNYVQLLESGAADLAIGRFDLKQSLRSQLIHTSSWVVLLSRENQLLEHGAGGRMSLSYDHYIAAPHVVIVPPGSSGDPIGEQLEPGVTRRIALTIPHIAVLASALRGTQLIATLPDILAKRFAAEADLCVCEVPVPLTTNHIHQWWHRRNDGDAGHLWLRQLVVKAGGLSESERRK